MNLSYVFACVAMLVPAAAAVAQMSDAAYCSALTQKYQTYVATEQTGRNPQLPTVDAQNAIAQCQAGNAGAGIPVLEQKLRDAKVELPNRS